MTSAVGIDRTPIRLLNLYHAHLKRPSLTYLDIAYEKSFYGLPKRSRNSRLATSLQGSYGDIDFQKMQKRRSQLTKLSSRYAFTKEQILE